MTSRRWARQVTRAGVAMISFGLFPLLAGTVQAQSYVLEGAFGSFGSGNGQFRAPQAWRLIQPRTIS